MIQQRNQIMRQVKELKRRKLYKKLITQVNAGVLLLSAGSVINHISAENTEVKAQSAAKRFSPTEFIGTVANSAQTIAKNNNLYASVMIAQAALESGWGNSSLAQAPNYNLFGIKGSYNGQSITVDTLEDPGNGNYYQIKDSFKRYNSYAESLQDYANTLTGTDSTWRAEFYAGALRSNTNTYQDATAHLTGRYATDTRYAAKLNNLIEQYGLTTYDGSSSNTNTTPVASTPVENVVTAPSNSGSSTGNYVIKAGDTLYRIAKQHGVNLNDLLAANGISATTTIYPSQRLSIPGGNTSTPTASEPVKVQTPAQSERPVASPIESNSTSGSYIVKAGDGLYRIAVNHGMSLAQLKSINGLSSDHIVPGQALIVNSSVAPVKPATPETVADPVEEAVVVVETETVVDYNDSVVEQVEQTSYVQSNEIVLPHEIDEHDRASMAAGQSHIVQPGDTLYSIAQQYGQSVETLVANNGGTNISVGQVIIF